MIDTTPILERNVYQDLKGVKNNDYVKAQRTKIKNFLYYMLGEDARYCQDLGHPAYVGQEKLIEDIRGSIFRIEAILKEPDSSSLDI
jgi:hypothetical protein